MSEIERLRQTLSDAEQAKAALEGEVAAKNLLIQEVDHRVKNNLQMVSSLLSVQTRSIRDPAVRALLDATRYRIEALGAVHKRLYQSADVSLFNASEFVRQLTRELLQSVGRPDIRLNLHLDPVVLQAKKASAMALIVNELVMNALKHAFPDNCAGTITIRMRQRGDDLTLAVEDDGIGLATEPSTKSFGMVLVKALAREFRARVVWTPLDRGTRVLLEVLNEDGKRTK